MTDTNQDSSNNPSPDDFSMFNYLNEHPDQASNLVHPELASIAIKWIATFSAATRCAPFPDSDLFLSKLLILLLDPDSELAKIANDIQDAIEAWNNASNEGDASNEEIEGLRNEMHNQIARLSDYNGFELGFFSEKSLPIKEPLLVTMNEMAQLFNQYRHIGTMHELRLETDSLTALCALGYHNIAKGEYGVNDLATHIDTFMQEGTIEVGGPEKMAGFLANSITKLAHTALAEASSGSLGDFLDSLRKIQNFPAEVHHLLDPFSPLNTPDSGVENESGRNCG